jgi:hypothetical protein
MDRIVYANFYGNETNCPTTDGAQAYLVLALGIVSVPIAAVALTSSWTATLRRSGGALRFLAGAGAGLACIFLFLGVLWAALCGSN